MEISNSSSLQDGKGCVHWKCTPFKLNLCAQLRNHGSWILTIAKQWFPVCVHIYIYLYISHDFYKALHMKILSKIFHRCVPIIFRGSLTSIKVENDWIFWIYLQHVNFFILVFGNLFGKILIISVQIYCLTLIQPFQIFPIYFHHRLCEMAGLQALQAVFR